MENGSFGDLITLPVNQYSLLPVKNPAEQIIFSQPLIVKDAIVAGRLIMRDREFLKIDEKSMLKKCTDKCAAVYDKSQASRDVADELMKDAKRAYGRMHSSFDKI